MKWAEELEKSKKVSDVTDKTTVNKALGKFIFTIDFMVNEVVGFDKYNSFKSFEANQIIEMFKLLLKESTTKLVEYAKSVEVGICIRFTIDARRGGQYGVFALPHGL